MGICHPENAGNGRLGLEIGATRGFPDSATRAGGTRRGRRAPDRQLDEVGRARPALPVGSITDTRMGTYKGGARPAGGAWNSNNAADPNNVGRARSPIRAGIL